jgi:hypothetical protein
MYIWDTSSNYSKLGNTRYTTLPPYRDRGVIYYWNYWLGRPFY